MIFKKGAKTKLLYDKESFFLILYPPKEYSSRKLMGGFRMKKNNILILLLASSLCHALTYTPRQRIYVKQRSIDTSKVAINGLLRDLENTLHTAAEKAGMLRRKINHLGSVRSIDSFRADLEALCTQIKDTLNMSEPRIAGELTTVE
jgi:hypothetical protein